MSAARISAALTAAFAATFTENAAANVASPGLGGQSPMALGGNAPRVGLAPGARCLSRAPGPPALPAAPPLRAPSAHSAGQTARLDTRLSNLFSPRPTAS